MAARQKLTTEVARSDAISPLGSCVLAIAFCAAAACTQYRPYVPPSEGHIGSQPPRQEPDRAIPPPARITSFVPPPAPAPKPQTYSVVVNEVPVKELLLALARDTRQNIDIHSGLQGLVSLNAINETLPAILDRVAKQVNMRHRIEGNTIIVSPDTPYLKTYRVGYVNMTRDTVSAVGVSGEITAPPVGAASGALPVANPAAGSHSGSASSGSSTQVRTVSKNDFWDQLRDNIRAILASTRARTLSAEEKAAVAEEHRRARDTALKQAEAVARAGQGATALYATAFRGPPQQQPFDTRDDIIVNPVSGTVSVLATERQHQLIQQHVDSITAVAQRQVLIEATIVEVQLANNYQAGIDWARVSQSGGIAFTQALLGGNLATAPFFALFFNQNNQRQGDIQLTVKLLEQFGNARVLSSPKLMALNNQTALLKVVDNVVYFEVQSTAAIAGAGGVITPGTTNTTAKTVAVGVVMGVIPQISDDGRVQVTVRPTITRLNPRQPFVNDPNPSLCTSTQSNCIRNLVPQVQVREMESVLQLGNGQTVILGGLMQDDVRRNRDQVPIVGNVRDVGEFFAYRDEQVSKTELVIFLRTTIVSNPTLEADELKFFDRFLPRPEMPPRPPEGMPSSFLPPTQQPRGPPEAADSAR
jgi:general secretion pathway protein D